MSQQNPPSNPLSYPASQCILQHMEANKRYYLASRCPVLRVQHSMVPQKVRYFKLDKLSFQVNQITHSFFTRECMVPPQVPKTIICRNIDEMERLLTEPNPDLQAGSRVSAPQVPRLPCGLQAALEAQTLPDGFDMSSSQIGMTPIFRLLSKPAPPGREVCYTITGSLHSAKAFRLPIEFDIQDAIRKILSKYLSESNIFVDCLEIGRSRETIRIPPGLNLWVKELQLPANNGNDSFNAVWPSLTPCPKKVRIDVRNWHDLIFRNPLLANVESLDICFRGYENRNSILGTLRNKIIHVRQRDTLVFDSFLMVAHNWIEKSKAIGSKISFETTSLRINLEEVTRALQLVPVVREDERNIPNYASYWTPMPGDRELQVYGYVDPDNQLENLVMEVMEPKTIGQ